MNRIKTVGQVFFIFVTLCLLSISTLREEVLALEHHQQNVAEEDLFAEDESLFAEANDTANNEDEDLFDDDEDLFTDGDTEGDEEDEDLFDEEEPVARRQTNSSRPQKRNEAQQVEPKRSKLKKEATETMPQNSILFQRTCVNDPASGVAAFDCIAPSGWTAKCNVNWHYFSLDTPGVATVTAASPDERVTMSCISKQDFIDNVAVPFVVRQDGIDLGSYTTRLQYKQAGELSDWICRNALGAQSMNLLEEKPIAEETRSFISSSAEQFATALCNKLGPILSGANSTVGVNGYEGTIADRRYEIVAKDGKSYWIEVICISIGSDMTFVNHGIAMSNLAAMRVIQWNCPLIFLYTAESREEFDRWAAAFDMFAQNTALRSEFQLLNRKYAQEVQNNYFKMKTQQLTEMNRANAERMMQDSTDDSSEAPTLDMTEKWSDAILDLNTFQTNDGGTIKASTSLDHVYQNGDKFLGLEGSDSPPAGWDKLEMIR
ncbi:MAG: hypothetical protein Q4G68_03055 [Planctomycetia bacterium]|nr:hypothetical protein [Planctomycetia bacterium]